MQRSNRNMGTRMTESRHKGEVRAKRLARKDMHTIYDPKFGKIDLKASEQELRDLLARPDISQTTKDKILAELKQRKRRWDPEDRDTTEV